MTVISVKILGYKKSQRYPIWRTLQAAQLSLAKEQPDLHLEIEMVTSVAGMLRYTPVIAFPSLVMNEKLVCVGRFPARGEVLGWLAEASRETLTSVST